MVDITKKVVNQRFTRHGLGLGDAAFDQNPKYG